MHILSFFLLPLLLLLSSAVADPNKTTGKLNTTQVQKELLSVTQKNITNNSTKNIDSVGESLDATDSTTEVTQLTTVEALNSTIDTCDNNDTECNGVNATSVSPIKNDTRTKNKTNEENKNHARHKIETDINICSCNLQVHFCDINCCCDPDCSPSDKTIFGYCEIDENRFYDSRYCNYIKYIYVNNTPFEWELNQDGLFCIISSNVPDMYFIQNEEPIKSIDNVKLENHFWNQEDTFLERSSRFVSNNNYGFGDSIMIVRDDSSTDTLRLPRNFLGSPCIYEEDVYYLKDVKNSCSQMTIDDVNSNLNFSSFYKKFKIVRSPKLFNITKLKNNIYKNCPKNICLEIEPKLCDIHLTSCFNVEENAALPFHCSYDLKKNLNTCLHAVEKIHYKFYHNGTSGLSKVAVLGVLRNFTYHFGGKDLEFFQDFSVEFAWINQIKNYSEIFSGNPGYLTGKPVLLGIKRDNGNTSLILRNSTGFLENFLVFPANVEGSCVRNATFNTPIQFEYHMIAQCKLYRKFSFNNKQNATDMCRSIQKYIFDLWGLKIIENNESLVIGLYGNANASTIQDWTSVLYRIDPKTYLNNTQGAFINSNKTLVCRNISSLFDVDVIYSRIDLQTVLNQQKVLGVSFSFGDVRNYSFSLNKQNGSFSLDLALSLVSQVSFYDVTGDKTRKFVDAPSFDIRLPYDFFYPFIRVGNGVGLVMPNNFVIVLILYIGPIYFNKVA